MDSTWLVILQGIVILMMSIGVITLVIPVLPGLTVIWAAALLYGLAAGFNQTGWIIFTILTLIMLVGNAVDYFIVGMHVRQSGASWRAISLALLAGLVGTFLFPPIGGLFAALIALFVVELIRLGNWHQALSSSRSMVTGLGWATLMRLGLGTIMIVIWTLWAYGYVLS